MPATRKQIQAKPKNRRPVTDRLELDPTTPIPFEKGSGFDYISDLKYLPFLAPKNDLAKTLLEARLLSCTHNACITTKKDYCAGNGFEMEDDTEIKDKKFLTWLNSMNLKNESIIQINKAMFENLFTFGNVPIELVRFTVNGKKNLFIYVHDMMEWRLGEPDDDGLIHYAIRSKLFLREDSVTFSDKDYSKVTKLPIYSPRKKDQSSTDLNPKLNWIKVNGTERTLIWYKHSVAGYKFYGLPESISSLIDQILEFKTARHNLDNIENNMIISAILALKGAFTEKEINRIAKRVLNVHTGDGKRGRVMVVGSEEGIDGSDFHSFDTHKEGSYKELDDKCVQKIILAHKWDAILAGLLHTDTLGKGMGFLTKIYELKKNTVIRPAQDDLMDQVWWDILTLASAWFGFKIDPDKMRISNKADISALTDVDITPAVTVDEVREGKGLTALEDKKKGKMLLGELKGSQMKGVYVKDGSSNQTQDNVQPEPAKT